MMKYKCCINKSVSNIKITIWMINNMMQQSFEDKAGIRQLTEVLKPQA